MKIMMKLINSALLAVVLVAAAACCFVAGEMDRESCKKLVEDPKANWETASQVAQCYHKVDDALTFLEDVVMDSPTQSNCASYNKMSSIRYFNQRTIRQQNGEDKLIKHPKSIMRAFLAYTLRLSASCRNDMVKVVSSQLDGILADEDFAELDRLTNDKGPVAKLFALDKKNKQGLALPSPMVKLLKAQNEIQEGQIGVRVPANALIGRVQAICLRRFKPIYEKIMDPVIELASLGFNYEPETSTVVDEKVAKKVSQWYRVVFICKLLDKLDIIEDPNVPAGQMKLIDDNLSSYNPSKRALNYPQIKKVEFDYELADERQGSGDDRLVDVNDGQLMKAIKQFHEPSLNLGMKASLKMAGSSLAKKVANTFGGEGKNGADAGAAGDDEDQGMAQFFAKYAEHLKSAVSMPPKPNERNQLIKKYVWETLQWGIIPVVLVFPWIVWIMEDIEHGPNPYRFNQFKQMVYD